MRQAFGTALLKETECEPAQQLTETSPPWTIPGEHQRDMEPPESTAGQKCAMETEGNTASESTCISTRNICTKRNTFAGSKGKDDSKRQGPRECSTAEHPGKEPSSACGQPSQEKQRLPRTYSYRLRHAKPQADSEVQASPLTTQLQSLSSEHQGGFSRKSATRVPTSFQHSSQSGIEQLESMLRKVPKSKKPGKYICHYCGRACAKPSVLKKHIRSHTGERPYPCIPCGFSFKTKSNLYKHKKSHAHNIKAGLIPFSEMTSRCKAVDRASLGGEAEAHSDYEQSTDTDEEVAVFLNKGSPVPRIALVVNRSSMGSEPESVHSCEELGGSARGIPIVVASEQGMPTMAGECSWLTNVNVSGQKISGDEFPTIKQKLALRLTGKKGQDPGTPMNLLSPHSKGSTDSGYFSRSESAEQQITSPNTNAKSYEEIMFGKFYKLSPRSRHAIASKMATATSEDRNAINIQHKSSITSDSRAAEKLMESVHQNISTFGEDDADSQIKVGSNLRQCHPDFCQINAGLVETVSDTGLLVRSNSMPTSHAANLNAPQGLQGSHSFDERMTSDTVFYRSSVGLRRLRRQAAFEFITQEGHTENENSGNVSRCIFLPSGTVQQDENSPSLPEVKRCDSFSAGTDGHPETQVRVIHQKQVTETATRKRRKKKSVGDEEDFQAQHDSDVDSSVEMLVVEYDSKQENRSTLRTASPGARQMYSAHREPENFPTGTCMTADDAMVALDIDKKTGGNVISVIQHTNSLSRPSSFEKADSIDQSFYPSSTLTTQYSEQSDSERYDEAQCLGPRRSGSTEIQQVGGDSVELPYRLPHKLVRQANIQVPEIRVTEEPDKLDEGPDASIKEPEKHMEDFQWPQRSETLSQLPAEKLPPKKKRLRLAEMEHSSGESSFESTCTSLSRSPSQESHLSPSSSFSMSFDREEGNKPASQAKQDDFGKQSEFLTVPCGVHPLSVRNQSRRKEVRRASSEQAASALIPEVPETRSKSFDYGGLLCSSEPGDIYTCASAMKERRRGYLVRQAPLSVYPESGAHEKVLDIKVKEEQQENSSPCLLQVSWPSGASGLIEKPQSSTAHNEVMSKKSEVSLLPMQRPSHLLQQRCLESAHGPHEVLSQDVMQYSSPYTRVGKIPAQTPQPEQLYHAGPTRGISQHLSFHTLPLQKLYIRQANSQKCQKTSQQTLELHSLQDKSDSEITESAPKQSHQYLPKASPWSLSDLLSKAFSSSVGLSEPVQSIVAGHILGSQLPLSETSVPVRIQMQVPSYDNVMYTNVSHVLVTHCESTSTTVVICNVKDNSSFIKSHSSDGAALPPAINKFEEQIQHPIWKLQEAAPAKMNTGIPLTLTSGTISTTDASGAGGNKRILSPANSMELFIEATQQKRVKEERMYGQIVEELSAVELSSSNATRGSEKSHKLNPKIKRGSEDYEEEMTVMSPLHYPAGGLLASETCAHRVKDTHEGTDCPEDLDVDEPSPSGASSATETQEDTKEMTESRSPLNMLVDIATGHYDVITGSTILLTDIGDDKNVSHFPSLCTSTSVSWCFLNYTKPNNVQTNPVASVYSTWFVSSYNPNPPDLNTKTTLASLRSKQRKTMESYTTAPMYQPAADVVSSLLWKQTCEQNAQPASCFQEKVEAMQLDTHRTEKKPKETGGKDRAAEGHRHKEAPVKPAEPNRIKIFEGGYKSNEDYVYVRGRGRGKYICEECGIRCKKPSMLKKHIRTHTDVRPYVCKACNFAFKTKGNLTKHMKSKAHMKKCVELGVSLTSVETAEAEEADNTDEGQSAAWKVGGAAIVADHQFSDADDSEAGEEEADENDEDDDEDDEYEGDSTPKTRSRSTSPQQCGTPSLPVTASSRGTCSDSLRPGTRLPLLSFRQKGERSSEVQMAESQRFPQGVMSKKQEKSLDMTSSMDKAFRLSPDHSLASVDLSPSALPSPGYDSSPHRDPSPTPQRYLCPSREVPPQVHLRHISPKKDVSIKRGLSPRGRPSLVPLIRPLSPGRDINYKRELSPRSRPRPIRPISPRKGIHHHVTPWSQAQNMPSEFTTAAKSESPSNVSMELRKTSTVTVRLSGEEHCSQVAPSTQQGLFSHLPLHSQLQVRTPVSVIPIGGIQIIPPTAALSSARLPKSPSVEPSASTASVCRSQPGGEMAELVRGRGALENPQNRPTLNPHGAPATAGSPDESVRMCTQAIASLRISAGRAQMEPSDDVGPTPPEAASHLNS